MDIDAWIAYQIGCKLVEFSKYMYIALPFLWTHDIIPVKFACLKIWHWQYLSAPLAHRTCCALRLVGKASREGRQKGIMLANIDCLAHQECSATCPTLRRVKTWHLARTQSPRADQCQWLWPIRLQVHGVNQCWLVSKHILWPCLVQSNVTCHECLVPCARCIFKVTRCDLKAHGHGWVYWCASI